MKKDDSDDAMEIDEYPSDPTPSWHGGFSSRSPRGSASTTRNSRWRSDEGHERLRDPSNNDRHRRSPLGAADGSTMERTSSADRSEDRLDGRGHYRSSQSGGFSDFPSEGRPPPDESSQIHKNASSPPLSQRLSQGEAWRQLEQLQRDKRCFHCSKRRWQHSLLPVCTKCQQCLDRVTCQHCMEEFLQHDILIKAEHHFARVICLSCARNVSEYGLPKSCNFCGHWAVFGNLEYCDRCTQMLAKYGTPEKCVKCLNKAAFRREPEKIEKVDNLSLCFRCTINYKKQKYKSQKKDRPMETVKAPSVDIASSEKIDALKREIEKQKGLAENVKSQLAQCQQQLKKKDADLLNFAQKIEQENFLLQKEAEENRRKSTRDEQRIAQLLKEMADVDKTRDREITKLIEANQEERDKFNELIDKMKFENEQLQEEVSKKRQEWREAKNSVKDEQKSNDRYRLLTEKRVLKLSQKYVKTIEKHEERAKQRNKLISDLRKEVARLRADKERYLHLERQALGFGEEEFNERGDDGHEEEDDDDDVPLIPHRITRQSDDDDDDDDDDQSVREHKRKKKSDELQPSKKQRTMSQDTTDVPQTENSPDMTTQDESGHEESDGDEDDRTDVGHDGTDVAHDEVTNEEDHENGGPEEPEDGTNHIYDPVVEDHLLSPKEHPNDQILENEEDSFNDEDRNKLYVESPQINEDDGSTESEMDD